MRNLEKRLIRLESRRPPAVGYDRDLIMTLIADPELVRRTHDCLFALAAGDEDLANQIAHEVEGAARERS